MMNRRTVLRAGAVLLAGGGATGGSPLAAFAAETVTLPFETASDLVKYPQKRSMIGLTSRPPQLETPLRYSTKTQSRQTMRSSYGTI